MWRKVCPQVLVLALLGCGARPQQQIWGVDHAADAKLAARLSDADLQRMVERLFVEDDRDDTYFGLRAAGQRAVPFLIRALDDPRTRTKVFRRGKYPVTTSPFQRISNLLRWAGAVGAVKPLTSYLQHPNLEFRRQAVAVLAGLAAPDCLEPVKSALADSDRRIRQEALSGLNSGLERNTDPAFRDQIFAAVLPLLKDGRYDMTGPAQILAKIDVQRAIPILESRDYFNSANPQLRDVLEALNRDDVRVPLTVLMPLMKELESRGSDYAAALLLYARNPDSAAERTFRALLSSADEFVAGGAAEGLQIVKGVDPGSAIDEGWKDDKFAALTPAQQYYLAVSDYQAEVDNGGHRQYFYNSASDHNVETLQGLRAMGLARKAAILEYSQTAFPGGHAPTIWDLRRQIVTDFSGAEESVLSRADEQFYDSEKKPGERVTVALALWAVNHPQDFKKPR